MEAAAGDMHQIYLLQTASQLGMKEKKSEFPMKMLTHTLKRVIFMEILYDGPHIIIRCQIDYFMIVFTEVWGDQLTGSQ